MIWKLIWESAVTVFERLITVAVKPWVIVGCLGLITLSFLYLDQPIAYYYHHLAQERDLYLLEWLTQLGLGGLYLISLFLLAIFFRYIYRKKLWEVRTWFLWLSVVLASVICFMLKVFLGRARPELLFSGHLYGFYGFHKHAPFWSFPSGHTTTIMAFVFGLSALFPRYCYLYIFAGLALAATRIMLTAHFLSDVLVATYLALLEVGLLFWWFQQKKWLSVEKS